MSGYFAPNLRQLAFIDAELAERIGALPPPTAVKILPTRSGLPSALAVCTDGAEVALHSLHDPVKQAHRFIAGMELRPDVDAFAMIGMGLGYHVQELLRRVPAGRHVLVIESREDVLRAALESRDLGAILGRPHLHIFAGTDYVGFLDWLKVFLNGSNVDSLSVLRHMESYRLNPAFYGEISLEMEKATSRRQIELSTLVTYGEELETNVIRNLPQIASAAGVNRFTGALKGRPAFLIGAGPSLTQALPHLKRVQDRAVLVVADTATKLLLREGIRPHAAALLDMTDKTMKFFENLDAAEAPALVFDPDACWKTVHAYPGPRITFESIVPWTTWAALHSSPKGTMEKGISVAHTGYQFLREAGADPLILVGIDLGFPGDTTHAEGVVLGWGTGRVAPKMQNEVMLPSVTGGQIRSVVAFKTFVTVFEILVSRTAAKVVNTSPGGALIRGTENLPIEQAIERYVPAAEDPAGLMKARLAEAPPVDWGRFRRELDTLRGQIGAVGELSRSALRWLKQTERLDPSNKVDRAEFATHARKINKNRVQILAQGALLPLLQRVISGEALEVRRLGKEIRDAKDEEKRHRLEQQRMVYFFAAYLKATEHAGRELQHVLRELPA